MLAAQHAPTGAKICTIRATRTTGKKFFSRLRIQPTQCDLKRRRRWESSQVPALSSGVAKMSRKSVLPRQAHARRRAVKGETQQELAASYNVSRSSIQRVLT
jgi:hypothetical protein